MYHHQKSKVPVKFSCFARKDNFRCNFYKNNRQTYNIAKLWRNDKLHVAINNLKFFLPVAYFWYLLMVHDRFIISLVGTKRKETNWSNKISYRYGDIFEIGLRVIEIYNFRKTNAWFGTERWSKLAGTQHDKFLPKCSEPKIIKRTKKSFYMHEITEKIEFSKLEHYNPLG